MSHSQFGIRAVAAGALVMMLLVVERVAFGQTALAWKVEDGVKRTYEISQFSKITATGYDQQYDTGFTLSVTNGQRVGEGHITQTLKVERLRQNYNHISPGLAKGSITFDSSLNLANADDRTLEHLLEVNKALVGAEFSVELDQTDRILTAKGAESLPDRTPATPAGVAAKRRLQWLTNESVQKGFEFALGRFAPRETRVGDMWEEEDHVNVFLVGPLIRVQRRYEYTGPAQLDGQTLEKLTWKETKVASKSAEKAETTVLESKGTLYFDRQRGFEVQSDHVFHVRYGRIDDELWTERRIETATRLKP